MVLPVVFSWEDHFGGGLSEVLAFDGSEMGYSFGQFFSAFVLAEEILLYALELKDWGTFDLVDLNAIAIFSQFEESVLDHPLVNSGLVVPSNLPRSWYLIRKQSYTFLGYFSLWFLVEDGKDGSDILFTHG